MRTDQRGFEQNSILTIITFLFLYVMIWLSVDVPSHHIMFSLPSFVIYLIILSARFYMVRYGKAIESHYSFSKFLIYVTALFWSVIYSLEISQNGSLEKNLLIIIFLMGIAAAGAISLSKDNKMNAAFLLLLLMPSSLSSFIFLDEFNAFIGVAFILYFFYLVVYSRKYYLISQENIKSKKELEEQKSQLEDSEKLLLIQNQQLGNALSKAKEADKSKSLFLANMSHEIRTPLNGIIGMSHLIKQSKLDNDQAEKVSIIEYSAETLVNLVNDILDFSKIEAGHLELDLDHFHLDHLLSNTCSLFIEKSKEKSLKFGYTVDPQVPEFLYNDQLRIRQILINLINNAIKFTKEGSVNVNIQLLNKNDHVYLLKFSVSDTGLGISEENQDKLFKAFSQTDASFTRKFGGTGLGLAISKRLAELMGGEIGVKSKIGEGSVFWFTIETKEGEEKQSEKLIEPQLPTRKLNILLAEDNKVNVMVAQQVIENVGHHVRVANNGVEAVDLFQKNLFDIILMDIMMPEMDGLEATWIIRQLEREKELEPIPILALTANVVKEDQIKYVTAGMNDYLSKPIRPDILIHKISELVKDK